MINSVKHHPQQNCVPSTPRTSVCALHPTHPVGCTAVAVRGCSLVWSHCHVWMDTRELHPIPNAHILISKFVLNNFVNAFLSHAKKKKKKKPQACKSVSLVLEIALLDSFKNMLQRKKRHLWSKTH
jgi:hypothetical protein